MSSVGEFDIPWWNLSLGDSELSSLTNAFAAKKLSYNSIGKDLEKNFCELLGVKYSTVTTSGSVSLLIALKVLGVGPGDEVIIPNRTFQATANAVYFTGAHPIIADVELSRGLITVDEIRRVITPRTKVVIVVHLNGRVAEVKNLKEYLKEKNIYLIEDAAQAMFSKYQNKYAGTIGDIGCFSLGVTKFLTSGQGGLLVTDSDEINKEIKKYIFHAMSGGDPMEFKNFGFNFRQSDLLSSLALSQLKDYQKKQKKFIDVYRFYEKTLINKKNISLIKNNIGDGEVPIWIEVLTDKRDELFEFFKKNRIQSVKFYNSINRSEYFNQDHLKFKNSEVFEKNGLILPCGPDMKEEQKRKVAEALERFNG